MKHLTTLLLILLAACGQDPVVQTNEPASVPISQPEFVPEPPLYTEEELKAEIERLRKERDMIAPERLRYDHVLVQDAYADGYSYVTLPYDELIAFRKKVFYKTVGASDPRILAFRMGIEEALVTHLARQNLEKRKGRSP